ncbi:hypothetical protein [Streptacidiphilus sp. P02-A3a]|uniref:hypothetical protein n=1 Tax=Streptacidiphilus sp. P02-A3a TaxID=2704468 RepID=UPI0015FDED40|nr:hypothetical protein [Streptacidiphilus sp. P02-A3a]QMU70138.1 hypothetical protein GXP74_19790 [Streptacidiphilus sp. P02-A3a]QMU70412.1 hypothetical protein GXP74_21565 [Streptacidiphilus sp. P02-A3a]
MSVFVLGVAVELAVAVVRARVTMELPAAGHAAVLGVYWASGFCPLAGNGVVLPLVTACTGTPAPFWSGYGDQREPV